MSNSFSTPLRVGAVVLGVVALVAVGLVIAYGSGEGRWVQGALGASPTKSGSPEPSPSESPTTASAEPTPSGSPSPSTAAQIKAKNIADAKARLVEYYATVAEVANSGYTDWEGRLQNFWGTREMRVGKGQVYDQFRDQGVYTEGVAKVVSIKVTKYTPANAGFEEMNLDACIDFSQVKTFDADGTQVPRDASVPERYIFIYEARNQGEGNEWAFIGEVPDLERVC